MGYKTELQSNNADLLDILKDVEALPIASGGTGGDTSGLIYRGVVRGEVYRGTYTVV